MLRLAAAVERDSEHPLAAAIVDGAEARGLELPRVATFEAVPGHGVRATVEGRSVVLGNRRLMDGHGIDVAAYDADWQRLADEGKTPMYVALDGAAAGLVAVADTVKDDSVKAIRRLKAIGLEVVMITGDNLRTAEAIARQVGVDRVLAEVLPAGQGSRGAEAPARGQARGHGRRRHQRRAGPGPGRRRLRHRHRDRRGDRGLGRDAHLREPPGRRDGDRDHQGDDAERQPEPGRRVRLQQHRPADRARRPLSVRRPAAQPAAGRGWR